MMLRRTALAAYVLAAACGGDAGVADSDPMGGAGAGGGAADGGVAGAEDNEPDPEPFVCPTFATPAESGSVQNEDAIEISGVAASVAHPGVLWAHNDDAGEARLLAFAADGRDLAVATIDAEVEDFEDVLRAGGPDAARDYLYLADTGDNDLERDTVAVLRIEEPAVDLGAEGAELEVAEVDTFTLAYDDGESHDAEAIVIEPGTGDLYVITKRQPDDPTTLVFRAAGVASAAGGSFTLTTVLTETQAPALAGRVVTATLSPDGALLLVGVKDEPFRLWPRSGSIADTLAAEPCVAPTAADEQVEAATFAGSGAGYVIVPEGERPPVYQVATATRGR